MDHGKPAYVTKIIPETNTTLRSDEEDIKDKEMRLNGINWIKYDGITDGIEATTKNHV